MVAQDLLCILEGGTDRRGDEVILRHDVFDLLVEIGAGHKAQIAVRDDADKLAVFADRHAGDLVAAHEVIRLAHGVLRRKEERINDNAVLGALDHIDLIGLTLNGHVLVNDADAALTGDGDGHAILGDGIHSGTDKRDIQPDFLCQIGVQIPISGQHIAGGGDQQHVVKGKPLLDKLLGSVLVDHSSQLLFSPIARNDVGI